MLRANTYDPRFNAVSGMTRPYGGTDDTVRTMILLAKGYVDPMALVDGALKGERSLKLRRHVEQIVNGVRPKDYASEAIAISRYWGNAGRYTRDPVHIEMIRDIDKLVDDAIAGRLNCDCDEYALAIGASAMVIGLPAQFVTVGFKPREFGREKVHTHVFARVQDPRTKVWWVLDPVAGRKTAQMLSRVRDYTIFDLDN